MRLGPGCPPPLTAPRCFAFSPRRCRPTRVGTRAVGEDSGGLGWDLSPLSAVPGGVPSASPALFGQAGLSPAVRGPAGELAAGQSIWQAGSTAWHLAPARVRRGNALVTMAMCGGAGNSAGSTLSLVLCFMGRQSYYK